MEILYASIYIEFHVSYIQIVLKRPESLQKRSQSLMFSYYVNIYVNAKKIVKLLCYLNFDVTIFFVDKLNKHFRNAVRSQH